MKLNKKGFTLTELSISMIISLVVMGIVTLMVAMAKKDMQITTTSASRVNEFYRIEKFVNNWFYTFSNDGYEIVTPSMYKVMVEEAGIPTEKDYSFSTNDITFRLVKDTGPELTYTLTYDSLLEQFTAETPSGTDTLPVTMIKTARFSLQPVIDPESDITTAYIIKMSVKYEESTYNVLFNYYIYKESWWE